MKRKQVKSRQQFNVERVFKKTRNVTNSTLSLLLNLLSAFHSDFQCFKRFMVNDEKVFRYIKAYRIVEPQFACSMLGEAC